MKPLFHFILIVILVMPLTGCTLGRESAQPTPPIEWPTQAWPTSTPEEQGADSAKLAQALQAIRQKGLNIHSLQIVRNGKLLFDAYFYPYDGKTVHEVASVTKSMMTTLIAIAAEQGKIDLDAPMVSFFPDRTIANLDARKEYITVRHLTSMSSGLECTAENDEQTLSEMMASPDWVQFVLDRKAVWEPGTHFVYCSPGMHLLSAILQKATGMTALEFAQANLFAPLGIQEAFWDSDPQGFNRGWGDLFLHPHDMAKLGFLWLNYGLWEGKPIVSRQWVEDSVKVQSKTGEDDDYGYGWRIVGKQGEYAAIGRGGQRIQVWPAQNIILVMTGGGADIDELESLIVPAFVDMNKPLAANPAGVAKLNAVLPTLLLAPTTQAVSPLPPLAQTISGKTFVFAPNPVQLKTIRLDFAGSETISAEAQMELTFADNQPPRIGKIGLDGVYRLSPGERGLPAGLRGSWIDAQTFVLEYDLIAARDAFTLRMHFADDRVTIDASERTRHDGVKLEGALQTAAEFTPPPSTNLPNPASVYFRL